MTMAFQTGRATDFWPNIDFAQMAETAMAQQPKIDHAVGTSARQVLFRFALLLLLSFNLIGLMAGKACADVVGLLIYQVQVFDGQKLLQTQKLAPGTGLNFTKSKWKFLAGTDWPDKVRIEVFWRWTQEKVCSGCYAEAQSDGVPVGQALPKTVDKNTGMKFIYENRPKNGTLIASIRVKVPTGDVVSPKTEITLKVTPVFKFPWVTIVAPTEGQTLQFGPSILIQVESFLPKKPPTTVRLEVQRKKGRKWTWAAPGTTDFPWASFPYNLPVTTTGEYRIRVQGKKPGTTGIYSPWRTFIVQ
jgi:hypothetical protein